MTNYAACFSCNCNRWIHGRRRRIEKNNKSAGASLQTKLTFFAGIVYLELVNCDKPLGNSFSLT